LLQIPSTSFRAESSLNSSSVDESELVRRLRDQISRLKKDIIGLHDMATLVKKKNKIVAAIEQHALDRFRVATESLSCKQSIASLSSSPDDFIK
jgi:BioD-like phosphotransacetylase family protein